MGQMLGLSSIFLFNFFYMYFATRPRPALTAVVHPRCIKYYMYSSFAMSFKTTSSIIIITNNKDLINILHKSILLMCVPLILVALKYILTCDNGMKNKISL